jgi:uncharacterized protein YecT (DUF1311 family)
MAWKLAKITSRDGTGRGRNVLAIGRQFVTAHHAQKPKAIWDVHFFPTNRSQHDRWSLSLRRLLRFNIIALICLGALSRGYVSTSLAAFDCNKAYLRVDFVICSSSEALSANGELTQLWNQVNEQLDSSQKSALLGDQRQWISEYGARCNVPGHGRPKISTIQAATHCVINQINERIDYLNTFERQQASERSETPTQEQNTSTKSPDTDTYNADDAGPSTSTSWLALVGSLLISVSPIILVFGCLAAYGMLVRMRCTKTLSAAGIKRRHIGAFASHITNANSQLSAMSTMTDEDLLWSFFLPEHRSDAKELIAKKLAEHGYDRKYITNWMPSTFTLPSLIGTRDTIDAYYSCINSRLVLFNVNRACAIFVIVLLFASVSFAVGKDVPDGLADKTIDIQAQFFGSYIDAYLFYILYHAYMIGFFIVLIISWLICPMLFGNALRILLLRPFGAKSLTKSLRRLILANLAGRGYIYTLSDKNFRPNVFVTLVLFVSDISLFIFNPLVRGSLRVAKVKNDKTFYKFSRIMVSQVRIRVMNIASCGQSFNIRCTDAWWKCCVSLLLNSCEIIIIDASKVKEGTEWEIGELAKRRLIDRCFFIATVDSVDHAREVVKRHFGESAGIKIHLYNDKGEACDPTEFIRGLKQLIARGISPNYHHETVSLPAAKTA